MMKGLLAGFLLAVLILVGGVFYYFSSGMAPAATSDPPMPFEEKLAGMALHEHIKKQGTPQSPVPADEPNLLAAADVYKNHCAACHGLPGQPLTEYASGMYPQPTELFGMMGVTDDPVSETYWKVTHGIRLTGMPSFKNALTDTERWQVSQLAAHADKLPDSVNKALVPETPPSSTAVPPLKKK